MAWAVASLGGIDRRGHHMKTDRRSPVIRRSFKPCAMRDCGNAAKDEHHSFTLNQSGGKISNFCSTECKKRFDDREED